MQPRRGQMAFRVSLSLAIIACLVVAPFLKGFLLEAWYIRKLQSGENCDDAAEYLGRIRSVRAIPALVMVMKAHVEDMDPPGLEAAKAALVNIGKPAILALAAALKDEERETRVHAASTLSEMGSLATGALEALAEALQDEDDGVFLSCSEGRLIWSARGSAPRGKGQSAGAAAVGRETLSMGFERSPTDEAAGPLTMSRAWSGPLMSMRA